MARRLTDGKGLPVSTADWKIDESMGQAYFEDYKRDNFSQEFILFIDIEYHPGLDCLIAHIGDRKIDNVSATSSPEYGQL
jgi:hypothetical protein